MISTLKEVREALRHDDGDVIDALTKLDALIARVEKAEPQYLSIERVEGFPEKLEQGPQPLLYSDGINGCMVRRDDVWLALTSQLAIPQSAPSTSHAEPVGINGLTEAETNASMSVRGLSNPAAPSTSPLTDKEIAAAWISIKDPVGLGSQFIGKNGEAVRDFVRAIEAAHGIGAKP